MNRIVVLASFAVVFLFASSASAQFYADPDDTPAIFTSTTTTTSALVAGAIVLTVVLVTDDGSAMKSYLQNNAVALQQDLSLGGGDTVDDLAQMFGVQDRREFARRLRRHHRDLLELADPQRLDTQRAQAFVQAVALLRG